MSPTPRRKLEAPVSTNKWFGASVLLLLATLLASSCCHTWLSSRSLASNFVSPLAWGTLVGIKPSAAIASSDQLPRNMIWPDEAKIDFKSVVYVVAVLVTVTSVAGAFWLAHRTGCGFSSAFCTWAFYGSMWWCLLDLWEWTWIAAGIVHWESLAQLLMFTPQFWLAFCASGSISTLFFLSAIQKVSTGEPAVLPGRHLGSTCIRAVWIASGIYAIVFTAMNWRLYFNLLIPHGDSAMYEEHLWNVLHGKGFRSFLDQGLFLGEHIQFVHLFLIPLYILWPSHLLLECAESTALALGAFPVFWMTRRQSGSDRTALAAAVAYLLYAPMQFLDIEIDLKTFRPEAFGIPLLLLTLDQLDRRNLRGLLVGLAFTMTVKEDYAIVFAPLGLWIVWNELRQHLNQGKDHSPAGLPIETSQADRQKSVFVRPWFLCGIGMSVGSVVYLWVATRVVIPWFRSGAEPHYTRYFQKFGETPEQILYAMATQPSLLFGELLSTSSILYAIAMLAPVAFLPLWSRARLAVGVPLFGILCLNELAKDPRHQFHAPLVAIVFWSLAHAIPCVERSLKWMVARFGAAGPAVERALPIIPRTMLWTSSLTTGIFLTLSPLGVSFWDPGSNWNWHRLYGYSRRAELFTHVPPLIPQSSRVASTDFVHPRFTHHERSYDYSGYLRKVSEYEKRVPDDTDFIVIDTRHPYSEIKRPEEVPEYRDHPEIWELLPDKTEGYFIVLRRKR